MLVNANGNYTDLQLGGSSVTLTGGGIVQLSNDVHNNIFDPRGAPPLVNVNNTIEGAGRYRRWVRCRWTTKPAEPSMPIRVLDWPWRLNLSGATNEGLIEATSGGSALPPGGHFTQSGSGTDLGVWLELAGGVGNIPQ